MAMNETPFFFADGDHELFAILHRPLGMPNGTGFVFCHPSMEEKLWAHRVYVSLARDLAARGYAVLRFDHFGHGDSDGEFSESTVETHLDDIAGAIDRLRSDVPDLQRIGLFGLRLGATFAALAAARIGGIDRLTLWDPVVNGERYMQEVLRLNLTGQMAVHGRVIQDRKKLVELLKEGKTVNIEGYELGCTLFEQVSGIDLLAEPAAGVRDVLVLQAGRKGQVPRDELTSLNDRYGGRFAVVCEEPFWREIKPFYQRAEQYTAATLEWLGNKESPKELAHG